MRTFKPLMRQEEIRDTYHWLIGHREVEVRDTYHRIIMVEDCACVTPKVAKTTFHGMTFHCPNQH